MSRFRRIKRKKPKEIKIHWWEVPELLELIATVENYRDNRPGVKISLDQAYRELEEQGIIYRK